MKELKVIPADLFPVALHGAIQKNVDMNKELWARVPKSEDDTENMLFDQFVSLLVDVAELMDAVLAEMKVVGSVIFAEDANTQESNILQLHINDPKILDKVAKITVNKPSSIVLASYCFKSWHFYYETPNDFVEFIEDFLSPIEGIWKATKPRAGAPKVEIAEKVEGCT